MRGVAASNLQHNALAWYWRGWVGWGVGLGEGEEPRGWAITIQDYARGAHQRSDRSTRYTQDSGERKSQCWHSKLSYIKVMPYGSGRHHIG